MILNPIRRALSSIRTNRLQCLLMGGQACIVYGAAEFSRDLDIALLVEERNLDRLQAVLVDLDAECIAVPPFAPEYLLRRHAVPFRCRTPEAARLRLDVMALMRGVDPFPALWARRTTITLSDGFPLELMSLPDLVQAKKTQRNKDWPILQRLVERSYFGGKASPTPPALQFWLLQLRTPTLLLELAHTHLDLARELSAQREVLSAALTGDAAAVEHALAAEERREREADQEYWAPLKQELARLRRRSHA